MSEPLKKNPEEGADTLQASAPEGGVSLGESQSTQEVLDQQKAADKAAIHHDAAEQTDAIRADIELEHDTQESQPPSTSSSVQETGSETWWGPLLGGISVAASKVKEVLGTLGKSISDGLTKLMNSFRKTGQDSAQEMKGRIEKAIYNLSELLKPDAPVFTFLSSKSPRITSRFGKREAPYNPGHYETHNGVDISLATKNEDIGEPIVATKPLVVQKVGKSKSGANEIVLQDKDDPSKTYGFGHLEELPDLEPGTVLEPGALIGKIGNTGEFTTGAHLHFTVRENGQAVDPLSYSGLA